MLARAINRAAALRCAHTFSTCEQALAALDREPLPNVILLDVGLPGMNGIQGIREIKKRAPSVQALMLTVYDDHLKVFDAICAGASGYLLKTDDDQAIVDAIQEVLHGGAPMNPRVARLVLGMLGRGFELVLDKDGRIKAACRRKLVQAFHKLWHRELRWRGKLRSAADILELQVSSIKNSFLGKDEYRPFRFRW